VALLRRVIGDALRARRQGQQRTLRDVSTAANVSLGYLSEIERGQKEASSELLAAICEALGSHVSEVIRDASDSLARVERADAPLTEPAVAEPVPAPAPAVPEPALAPAATISDGRVSVSVRRDGPFRTTLHAVRNRPRRPVAPRG
jgi:transcriptional regulator with XRE-family HTH domain